MRKSNNTETEKLEESSGMVSSPELEEPTHQAGKGAVADDQIGFAGDPLDTSSQVADPDVLGEGTQIGFTGDPLDTSSQVADPHVLGEGTTCNTVYAKYCKDPDGRWYSWVKKTCPDLCTKVDPSFKLRHCLVCYHPNLGANPHFQYQ